MKGLFLFNRVHRRQAGIVILIFLAAVLIVGGVGAAPSATPDSNWKTTSLTAIIGDCNGAGDQSNAATFTTCQSYATDVYESIDYTAGGATDSDIMTLTVGHDANFLYVEFDLVAARTDTFAPGHHYVVDLDADGDDDGDYYVAVFGKDEYKGSTWVDTKNPGRATFVDSNDDAGGSTPWGPDASGSQDGYESDNPGKDDTEVIWSRTVSGNIQMAIALSHIGNPASNYWVRGWTAQSSTHENDKLYWHDEQATTDLPTWNFDNIMKPSTPTAITLENLSASAEGMLPAVLLVSAILLTLGALGYAARRRGVVQK